MGQLQLALFGSFLQAGQMIEDGVVVFNSDYIRSRLRRLADYVDDAVYLNIECQTVVVKVV